MLRAPTAPSPPGRARGGRSRAETRGDRGDPGQERGLARPRPPVVAGGVDQTTRRAAGALDVPASWAGAGALVLARGVATHAGRTLPGGAGRVPALARRVGP